MKHLPVFFSIRRKFIFCTFFLRFLRNINSIRYHPHPKEFTLNGYTVVDGSGTDHRFDDVRYPSIFFSLIDEAKDIFAPIKVYLILPLIPFHLFDASVQHRQKKILIDPVLNIFLILLDKFLIPFFNILKFLCGLF